MTSKRLSIISPAHNIADHVDHLGDQLAAIDAPDIQFIIVDDGSTDGTTSALRALEGEFQDLTLLELAQNAGAGVARNLGFPRATGTYTLFFDADDTLHPDAVRATMDVLDETGADASINTYDFIRDRSTVNTGMNSVDLQLWDRFAPRFQSRPFALTDAPEFLRFTNYPWNKIIRTAPYQDLALSPFFGETRVNNDILGHWNILLRARTLVLVDEKMVTHHISAARDHLSNMFGAERLQLFEALGTLHDHLRSNPDWIHRFGNVYWTFAKTLDTWATARMNPEFLDAFEHRRRDLALQASFGELLSLLKSDNTPTHDWLVGAIG